MQHAVSRVRKGSAAIDRREFVPRDTSIGVEGSSEVVQATMAGDQVGHYSRRERQSTSGASFPGVRNRPAPVGVPALRGSAASRSLAFIIGSADALPATPVRGVETKNAMH
ncbi:MAG TPA: hypothetical protein VFB99_11315 [Vicinamibacterales bacterium]|nr:hypothetical protein [Vicinamibacterales bacterium]